MDRISELSDELLLKILSYLPTKLAVSTCILSKRWENLWMWLPKLDFVVRSGFSPTKCNSLRRFLDRNLPLYRAPVIECFRLELNDAGFRPSNVKNWVGIALSHRLRSLDIVYYTATRMHTPKMLPGNLYTCESLAILKLCGGVLLNVPQMVSLPSLKTLQLRSVRFHNEESLPLLLSNCPILEDLSVNLGNGSPMTGKLTVVQPWLQSLSLLIPPGDIDINEIVIKTPSLKYFKLVSYVKDRIIDCAIENMPDLVEAYLDLYVGAPNAKSVMGSITSVKHLTICSENMYEQGLVFNQLEHLKLCRCKTRPSAMLFPLLSDSPNLQVLDLFIMESHHYGEPLFWKQPNIVPKCMLSSLHTVNWLAYAGEDGERGLAIYLLKNAANLKTTTFKSYELAFTKYEMVKELALPSRASTTCELVFN